MAERLGEAVLVLRTDDTKFRKGLGKAESGAKKLDRSLQKTGRETVKLGDKFKRQGERMKAAMRGVGKKVAGVGRELRAMAIPLAALAAGALKMGFDFDEALDKIVGLVGVSKEQVDEWRKAILRLAPALGQSPKALADALFFIASAGFKGQEALDILEVSAKAAAGGLGETLVIADAVTNAMAAYSSSNLTAADATDTLVAAVQAAKVDAADLAPVLGSILPFAAQLGISFTDVMGALALLTKQSGSATQAATGLKGILSKLVKPSEQGKTALESVGLTVDDLVKMIQERGLVAALGDLRDLFGENTEAMTKVFEDVEGLLGVYQLLGTDMQIVADVQKIMNDRLGATDRALAAQAEGGALKAKQAWAALQVSIILVADVLEVAALPALDLVTRALTKFAETGPLVAEAFGNMVVAIAQALFRNLQVFARWVDGISKMVDRVVGFFVDVGKGIAGFAESIGLGGIIGQAFPKRGVGGAFGILSDPEFGKLFTGERTILSGLFGSQAQAGGLPEPTPRVLPLPVSERRPLTTPSGDQINVAVPITVNADIATGVRSVLLQLVPEISDQIVQNVRDDLRRNPAGSFVTQART